ncbi:flagellar M-ring protein FliF C-terminal domain-containing protein [Kaarinaea lacus]
MSEKSVNQQSSELSGRVHSHNSSAFFATLFTGVLALVLISLFWVYNPSYVVLIQKLDSETLARVSAELQKSNIAYQYDSQTGNILVPENSLYQAKFVLGTKGLEQSTLSRLLLDDEYQKHDVSGSQPVSQSVPTKYFALETELARTISSINNIQWARVHLAIDDKSATPGDNKSRASVFVRLARGRSLGESQITSISHLIAASVANLSTKNVTIIDQSGNLLKSTEDNAPGSTASMHYRYARILEQSYINELEGVLIPIFGESAVRVRVDANISFKESQQPSLPINQEQPSHSIKNISATVVVDNKLLNDNNGKLVSMARSRKELEKIEGLVKETIGFNEQRGDRVNVFNESFRALHETVDQENSGIFSEKNQLYYLKALIIAFFVLTLSYFVLRYLVQKVMEMKPVNLVPDTGAAGAVNIPATSANNGGSIEAVQADIDVPKVMSTYEALLSKTRQQVNDNPAHVAKVIKSWVRDNGR